MSIRDVVRVDITRETKTPSAVGFGTPLILAFHTYWTERARVYSEIADMLDDGFTADEPAVRMATAIFSQNPRPNQVIVGREANTQKQKIRITPVSANLKATYDYTVYVNGLAATFTTDASPAVAEICTGLKAAIDLLAQPVTVTDGTTYVDIESTTIPDQFRFWIPERDILIQKNTTPDLGGDLGIVKDLANIQLINDDWYTVHPTTNSEAVIIALAANIQTQIKALIASSADDEILDSTVITDIASDLQTAVYDRTMFIYHPKALEQYPCAAWAGKGLPKDPGSITWDLKTLIGIDYTELSSTEKTNLAAKNCNYYTQIAGINVTQKGITSGDEWFDVIHGLDWVQARMQEQVFGVLANADKIPYTDPGIAVVEGAVRAILKEAVSAGVFAASPEPTVTVPKAVAVSTADKANRILRNVKFYATLAGAIHESEVSGTVTV